MPTVEEDAYNALQGLISTEFPGLQRIEHLTVQKIDQYLANLTLAKATIILKVLLYDMVAKRGGYGV